MNRAARRRAELSPTARLETTEHRLLSVGPKAMPGIALGPGQVAKGCVCNSWLVITQADQVLTEYGKHLIEAFSPSAV